MELEDTDRTVDVSVHAWSIYLIFTLREGEKAEKLWV